MSAAYVALVTDRRTPERRIVGAGDSYRAARQDAARRGVPAAAVEVETAELLRWAHGAAFDAALEDFLRLRAFGPRAITAF